ncbi:hypothetical protein SAPIO_CDS4968 [Scedosporium apiospermum]|uniref:methylcrotonoyl-CoA carboxylase n=1 Tax=Pseudallescheria apiosperma TaxID=563466 RepID=A0A084G6Y3_PSEDA|nr:uncharacterized protein SAPIO_CDS4968 [Scedosporium apiospermum]KEZ43095.1 hypothetical protein SAPIO_CDS4968 [Scedosporium apiospermum]
MASSFPIQKTNGSLSQATAKAWEALLEQHSQALETASSEGTAASQQRHRSRGQLLARERVNLLLDSDSPFLELCALAGHDLEDSSPCASLVAGIGTVSGGAWNELTVLKQNRVTQIATENDLPMIGLVQSAGVFLPQQFKVFHKGGQIFRDLATRSAQGKPNCTVVFGSSTAGGAYHPAMSDYTIFVENQAQVFLGGPPLVKMATGEIVDAETLGGAKMHGTVTGLADQIATDEFDAIRKARDWVKTLKTPLVKELSSTESLPPRYSPAELLSIVDPDIRKALNMREVILRVVDDSRWLDFKPSFGQNLITAWANIYGKFHMKSPMFLHNVTGFMVGQKAEESAIIKHGAQMVSAVSCSTVPHISIIIGASYGAGNYAMCGRAYQPRFLFSWPSGRCSVMGPDQLVGVMESIGGGKNGTNGSVGKARKSSEELRQDVLRDGSCYCTSAVLLDDGVIDPRDTRDVLGVCLDITACSGSQGAQSHRGLARM